MWFVKQNHVSGYNPLMPKNSFFTSAQRTIKWEAQAVDDLSNQGDADFEKACQILLQCKGRVVVTGMGKSGHIGNKIAATLASTGTPAFYVHPAEASHGDMGMITANDAVLALSNSGTTDEIVTILPLLKRVNVPLIAITWSVNSILASSADAHINASVKNEACPLDLAPTSSTTASLVMGECSRFCITRGSWLYSRRFCLFSPRWCAWSPAIIKGRTGDGQWR